jgi:beta-galactosidase/beta-glucuronidase
MTDLLTANVSGVPRSEYPRPQFVRVNGQGQADWLCLNGSWDFEIDHGDSGYDRGLTKADAKLSGTITVPFCPESPLSGVGNTDFMRAVWYKRTVAIPENWKGKRVLLHFGAVDYDATVWVNGTEVGRHRGGFTPFTCDLSLIATGGEAVEICVRARDTDRAASQPRGKQSTKYAPYACFYTRTTGIWQTVWMEATSQQAAMRRPRITPDVANHTFRLEVPLTQNRPHTMLRARVYHAGQTAPLAEASVRADLDFAPRLDLTLPEGEVRLWEVGNAYLYDVQIELVLNGEVMDAYHAYAGLRSISIDGKRVNINGKIVFQRTVLDQGYYPDGVMTAPTDQALIRDIELSLEAGFNGARLHQKVFEERFLYHADRLGYIVWGEFGDWGCSGFGPTHDHQQPGITYAAQWLEALERDYSHPALVGWCALNETWQLWHDRITPLDDATRALFLAAKAMDTTRPVLDTSGYAHRVRETDVYDSHYYIEEKDFNKGLEKFREYHGHTPEYAPYLNPNPQTSQSGQVSRQVWSAPYEGQPYWVSEFGGFRWTEEMARDAAEVKSAAQNTKDRVNSWGYGADPQTIEDWYQRFEATCQILLDNPGMFGYCYTQLTDIFPEENGIYDFDRKPKFDNARLREIQSRIAGIEQAG